MNTLLEVKDLQVVFDTNEKPVKAVNGVSFDIGTDEIVGIVGESGSGKSVTALSIMQLLSENANIINGQIFYKGENLLEKSDREMQEIRGKEVSMIFQNPMNSFNPVFKIGNQIRDVIVRHQDVSKKEGKSQAIEMLGRVGLSRPEARYDSYPHEFSGGMLQRAMIAMAFACKPKLLIADEPTTALDVSVQNEILKLLIKIKEDLDMSILLITHDLGVVANTCSKLIVMKDGSIVEKGNIYDIFENPDHDYTQKLIKSHLLV